MFNNFTEVIDAYMMISISLIFCLQFTILPDLTPVKL